MMKSIRHILCSLLLTLILASSVQINTFAEPSDNGQFKVNVEFGFNGVYRMNGYIPVKITVDNMGDDFIGKLQMRNHINYNDDIIQQSDINIASSRSISQKFVIQSTESNVNVIRILIVDDKGREVYNKKVSLPLLKAVNQNKKVIAFLSDEMDSLRYISPDSSYTRIELNEDNFPNNKYDFYTFDYILINNFDVSKLNDKQIEALKDWIEGGGTLVLGTGPYYKKTTNVLKDYIGIDTINDTRVVDFNKIKVYATNKEISSRSDAPFIVSNIEGVSSEDIYYAEDSEGLVYAINKGSGRIILFTFDLGMEPMLSYPSNNDVVEKFLDFRDNDKYFRHNSYYDVERFLKGIPELEIPSLKVIIMIICVYILLINPILYLYLKKKKKRHYLWVCIPALSILFVVLMYVAGLNTRLKEPVTQVVNTVYFDENSNQKSSITADMMLMTVSNKELNLESTDGLDINAVRYDGDRRYRNNNNNNTYVDYPLRFTKDVGSDSSITIHNVGTFESCNFEIQPSGELPREYKVDIDVYLGNKGLAGTIKNNYDYDLKEAVIFYKEKVYEVGNIASGETIKVDGIPMINEDHNSYFYSTRDRDELDINERFALDQKRRIISYVWDYNRLQSSKAKLVSWADTNFYKGFKVNDKDVKLYEKTLLTKSFDMGYKKGFKYTIEFGEIKSEGDRIEDGRDYAEYYGGKKETEIYYDIPVKNIDITKIDIQCNNYDKEIKCSLVKVNGERVPFKYSTTIEGKEIEEYVKVGQNKLNIHVELMVNNNVRLPEISIEGMGI